MSALLLTPWGWSCHRGIWCNKVVASRRCFFLVFFLSEPIDLIFVPPTCVQVAGPLLKFKFPIAKLPYHGLHHSLCATFSNSAEDRTHVHPITQHLRPPYSDGVTRAVCKAAGWPFSTVSLISISHYNPSEVYTTRLPPAWGVHICISSITQKHYRFPSFVNNFKNTKKVNSA